MVEPILYSAFGFLLATLLWLLFLPAFWRRAVRLTRARLIKNLPVSADAIVASQDRLRAEHAVAMRGAERRAELAVAGLDGQRLATAKARATELGHLADLADLKTQVATLEAENARLLTAVESATLGERKASEAAIAAKTASDQLAAELKATRKDREAVRLAVEQARIEAATLKGQVTKLEGRASSDAARKDAGIASIASLMGRAAAPERAGA